MTHKSASTMVDLLTPIWERVLQRPAIRLDDNFFDLGGDSLLAVELFTEIERVSGREMAPVTIYCAPTIAALAAVLEEPAAPRFPPLLQLKGGTEEQPIFLAHGLAGTAMDFYQLVKYVKTDRPIYGMQAKGTDGVDEPFERIEDLAQYHLDAIKELQPHGPYISWLLTWRTRRAGDGPTANRARRKGRVAGDARDLSASPVFVAKTASATGYASGHASRDYRGTAAS